jgi:hypothetical protein
LTVCCPSFFVLLSGTVICAKCRKIWKQKYAVPDVGEQKKKKNQNYQQGKQQKEDDAIKAGGHSPTKKRKLIDPDDQGDCAKAYSYAKRMRATADANGTKHLSLTDPCEFSSSVLFCF